MAEGIDADLQQALFGLDQETVAAILAVWGVLDLADLQGSFSALLPDILDSLFDAQEAAALLGAGHAAETIEELGIPAGPTIVPAGFSGTASDGRSMARLLAGPMLKMGTLQAGGVPESQVRSIGGALIERVVVTQLHDASRAASGVIVTGNRKVKGSERVVESGACDRCIQLSGRIYKWSDGFKRHENCRCTMRPANDPDYRTAPSPEQIFKDMSEAEQNQAFGAARAQAIRDGADLNQVVASKRKGAMSEGGLVTSEGTTRRGFAASVKRAYDRILNQKPTASRRRPTGPRLTPQAIYKYSNGNRDEAIEMLRRNGYIIDRAPRKRRTAPAPAPVQL